MHIKDFYSTDPTKYWTGVSSKTYHDYLHYDATILAQFAAMKVRGSCMIALSSGSATICSSAARRVEMGHKGIPVLGDLLSLLHIARRTGAELSGFVQEVRKLIKSKVLGP